MFPDISQDLVSDIWLRREELNETIEGVRVQYSNENIYGRNPSLPLHQQYNSDLVNESAAPITICYGKYVQEWFMNEFGEGPLMRPTMMYR